MAPKVTPRRKVPKKASEPKSSPIPAAEPIVVDKGASQFPSQSPTHQTQPLLQPQTPTQFLSQTTTLLEEEAELYFWDVQTEGFRNDGIVVARFVQQTPTSNSNLEFTYWLTASNDQGIILAHRIKTDMNQRFSGKMLSLTWNYMGDEGEGGSSWLLRFSDVEEYKKVVEVFTKCLWETLHQVSWGKIKVCYRNFCWVWNPC